MIDEPKANTPAVLYIVFISTCDLYTRVLAFISYSQSAIEPPVMYIINVEQ